MDCFLSVIKQKTNKQTKIQQPILDKCEHMIELGCLLDMQNSNLRRTSSFLLYSVDNSVIGIIYTNVFIQNFPKKCNLKRRYIVFLA